MISVHKLCQGFMSRDGMNRTGLPGIAEFSRLPFPKGRLLAPGELGPLFRNDSGDGETGRNVV